MPSHALVPFILACLAMLCPRWDDGDTGNTSVILYAASGEAKRWRPSLQANQPLLLRLGKANIADMLRGSGCAAVKPPPASAVPHGVFNVCVDSGALLNQRLKEGVGHKAQLLFSTGIEDGAAAESECKYPRLFDLYGVMSSTTNSLKTLYVCVGVATPFDLKRGTYEVEKSFALGIEVAVVAEGSRSQGPRAVLFRDKGRAINEKVEPPIVAHAMGQTAMRMRAVDNVDELEALIGLSAKTNLRTLLGKTELLSVLRSEKIIEGRMVFTSLPQFPLCVSPALGKTLTLALLSSGATSLATRLEEHAREMHRTFTHEQKMKSLAGFVEGITQLAALAMNHSFCQVLHQKVPISTAEHTRYLAQLKKLEPKLTSKPPPPPPPKPETRGPQPKRGAEGSTGNSPASKKGAVDSSSRSHDGKGPRTMDLESGPLSAATSDATSADFLTPLAMGQLQSNSSKLTELTDKNNSLAQQLGRVEAELAEERRKVAALEKTLEKMTVDLEKEREKTAAADARVTVVAGERDSIKSQLTDVRDQGNRWSAMFLAQSDIDTNKFGTILNALRGGEPSAS